MSITTKKIKEFTQKMRSSSHDGKPERWFHFQSQIKLHTIHRPLFENKQHKNRRCKKIYHTLNNQLRKVNWWWFIFILIRNVQIGYRRTNSHSLMFPPVLSLMYNALIHISPECSWLDTLFFNKFSIRLIIMIM